MNDRHVTGGRVPGPNVFLRGTHVNPVSLYEDQLEKRHARGEYIEKTD